jgi:PAS domain S-box-containing protein
MNSGSDIRRSPRGLAILTCALLVALAAMSALSLYLVEAELIAVTGHALALPALAAAVLPLAAALLWCAGRLRREWARTAERERWLCTTLRSISDGVVSTDAQGRITFLNPVAERMTGWSEAEALGRSSTEVLRLLESGTRAPVEDAARATMQARLHRPPRPPLRLLARDGTEHAVAEDAAPIFTAAGEVFGCVMVLRDVTERELADTALRASQEMFRQITNHSSDMIAVLDLHGRRLYNSASYGRILAPPGELFQTDSFADIHPEDRERIKAVFAETVRTGVGQRAEYRLRARDGSDVQMESLGSVIFGSDRRPEKVLVVARDITARHRADAALRREMAFSETLINSMPGIFYLYDARRVILRWNKNFETVTQYSAEEIPRLDPLDYFRPEQKQLVHERMLQCLAGGSADVEVFIVAKDGSERPYYVTGLRIELDGQPCMLGVGIDIGARLAAEEAVREARDHLEIKVAERTRDLAQANERLQELDRLKSDFVATMSHELRTPLNSIIGFTGILRQGLAGPVNEEQLKQLGMVHFSARHLLGLINDLLDLSRIESGKMEVVAESFALGEVIDEVVQSLTPAARQKQLALEAQLDPPQLALRSDRKKVFQILLNLANNAVKFTEHGRVQIAARAAADAVVIEVSDTGIGIKPENLGGLFQAFRQVDGSARRVYEGTGLGLYLCRKLSTMLGGSIHAQSEFGVGSRFTVTLPAETPATISLP